MKPISIWLNTVEQLTDILSNLRVTLPTGDAVAADWGFERWIERTVRTRSERKTCFFIGNGASASMASHFSADLGKNGMMHTQVFTDVSLITATSNDLGYDKVFSVPLTHSAEAGDMLVAISSSGESPNILLAIEKAREMGVFTVTLTGKKPDNRASRRGDFNFYVPADSYGECESAHAVVLHHWMDLVHAQVAK